MAKQKRTFGRSAKDKKLPKREPPGTKGDAGLRRQLAEARREQVAAAEILKVISRSTSDLRSVLGVIAETSAHLCGADFAFVYKLEADTFHLAASSNANAEWVQYVRDHPVGPGRGTVVGRTLLERRTVHVKDVLADQEYTDLQRQRLGNYRTMLGVPLLRDQAPIGSIVLLRTKVKPFSVTQANLVETFADQAVIAIENARLFEEVRQRTGDLSEALAYQTGSANILKVIASSPTDVEPALKAIVESACELCEAHDAIVLLKDGDDLRFNAHHGPIPIGFEKWPINRRWTAGRAFIDRKAVYLRDLLSDEGDDFPDSQELARHPGHRSILSVPLLREGESIGVIALRRTEVRPFSDKQIALLQTFADQAVIAIGNVQLFEEVQQRTRELSESLEQQTATAEVLSVISSSSGDLAPVFDAMLGKAMELCGANFGVLTTFDGSRVHTAATYGLPPAYEEYRQTQHSLEYGPGTGLYRLLQGEPFAEIEDLVGSEPYVRGDPNRRALVDLGGARCLLTVPLLKDDHIVGFVMIFRQERKRFSEKQITLLKQFAAQAVIAIENARLLNELRQRTSDLSKSLDDLRTAQDRLVQTEKLASLGQLTAGIAHEMKNPLNFVNNFSALSAELIAELQDIVSGLAIDPEAYADIKELTDMLGANLGKVVQHGKRADAIVKSMLLHSGQSSGEHRLSDINALVDESLNRAYYGERAETRGFTIKLEKSFDPAVGEVDLFPREISRALLNLISNGFYATSKRRETEGDGYEPSLVATTRNLGDRVEIRIRDNGSGIPPDVKERMFDPFFTTKPAGEGTGLGLSITHDIIVKQHGGSIEVDTRLGEFAEVRVFLPRTGALLSERH